MSEESRSWAEFFSILATLLFLCVAVYGAYLVGTFIFYHLQWKINEFFAGWVALLMSLAGFIACFAFLSRGAEYVIGKIRKKYA